MWGATLYNLNATFFIYTQIYKDNIMFIDAQKKKIIIIIIIITLIEDYKRKK